MLKFKVDPKKMIDEMVYYVYNHKKEKFLRELVCNAFDALERRNVLSCMNSDFSLKNEKLEVFIEIDKKNRILIVRDNGIGMNKDDFVNYLGTITKSGSNDFKNDVKNKYNVNIMGHGGVGFYSVFIVSDNVIVRSRKVGEKDAYSWFSSGSDGYDIKKIEKDDIGTEVILHIKQDIKDNEYNKFLEESTINNIVKTFSNIKYPINIRFR